VSGPGWLERLFGRKPPQRAVWQPLRFGPDFEWLDDSHVRLTAGPMAGESLEVAAAIKPAEAHITLYHYGTSIGECHIERTPPGRGVVLWDVGVREEYRRRGLASLMTLAAFRRLLAVQSAATFRIRMVRLIKPSDKDIELQNVGMGVIASRLGFESELDVERLLKPDNVLGVDVLPAKGDFPPGLKILIRTDPLVLVAFVLDSDSKKPVSDTGTYIRLLRNQADLYDWVAKRLVVISNGDFRLREAGIDRFLGCIARDQREAREFGAKVRGL
jgi:GNAT superfamily N-acetyltransferase